MTTTDTTRRVSARSCSINESATLLIDAEAKRLAAEGTHIVSFSLGEPDFPTPDVVKQAAIEAIEKNFTHYTQSSGIPELRKAVAEKFSRENGMPTDPAQVLVSAGGKHSIYNALVAIVDDGDEVIIPAPYWVSYPDMVCLVGGTPVMVPTRVEDRYKISPEQLRQSITPKTRAIILNSPSNPTGVMYSRSELEALGRVIAEAGIFVISDELYEKIIFDGNEHFSIGALPELAELAITINGVSKAYAMTGWRIGFMRGPKDVMAAAAKIQSQVTSCPSSISQMTALAALNSAAPDVVRMAASFAERRDLISGLLSEIPRIRFPRPDGAFYIFMDVSSYFGGEITSSASLAEFLLRKHHVATVPGSAFGDESAIRLSYACSEENIREGVKRIAAGLRELA